MMPRGRPRNTAAAAPTAPRGRANNRLQVSFAYKLVLNQWLLSLFNVNRFEDLAENLRNEALEGLDENNVHHFHHALTAQLFNLTQLPTELLLEYDQNIVRHTQRLNERRITRGEQPIVWKYFQYLTLIFTEIYLDRYFRDPKALLAALNAQVATYNADKPEADQIAHFDEVAEAWPQLNKLAYWSATGSGKTLLMHANILQYQQAAAKKARGCAFATRCAKRASRSSTRPPSGRRSRASPRPATSTPTSFCGCSRTASNMSSSWIPKASETSARPIPRSSFTRPSKRSSSVSATPACTCSPSLSRTLHRTR
jgi:hypothetical protein